jgi:hypothetical protein
MRSVILLVFVAACGGAGGPGSAGAPNPTEAAADTPSATLRYRDPDQETIVAKDSRVAITGEPDAAYQIDNGVITMTLANGETIATLLPDGTLEVPPLGNYRDTKVTAASVSQDGAVVVTVAANGSVAGRAFPRIGRIEGDGELRRVVFMAFMVGVVRREYERTIE